MFQLERKERILKYINEHKTVTTKQLCDEFGMTPVTIRSDINSLAQSGLVVKIHGGAMSAEHRLNIEIPISQKMQQNVEKKRKIAQCAAALINHGDMIILDSGSTTLEIARMSTADAVTVITNDVLIAKVQALMRRSYDYAPSAPVLEHRGAILNTGDGSLFYREQQIELSKNEYRILLTLMRSKGKVVSREKLMEQLWSTDSFVDENTLSVNVGRLRKKLEAAGLAGFIETKFGVGYLVG